jgi:hypothetical protein
MTMIYKLFVVILAMSLCSGEALNEGKSLTWHGIMHEDSPEVFASLFDAKGFNVLIFTPLPYIQVKG